MSFRFPKTLVRGLFSWIVLNIQVVNNTKKLKYD